jgi:hypothetical protein
VIWGIGMGLKRFLLGAALLALAAPLAACNPYPLPGPLVYGHCGGDAHTESYPHARYERDAYGCKSDNAGFLEGRAQGDRPGN